MYEELKIVCWPDPRLKRRSRRVELFDSSLQALTERMFLLMRESKGVGLAAPQVGLNIRLFVMNATGQPGDDRIYVNPVLSEPSGEETAEEGCLSLPAMHVNIVRSKSIRITAQDLSGRTFEESESGYVARIWQHEYDHLEGTLLTDRMGAGARMTNRKLLKELEDQYRAEHPSADARKHVGMK